MKVTKTENQLIFYGNKSRLLFENDDLKIFLKVCLVSETFSILKKNVPNHYPILRKDGQDSDLVDFFEDGTKVKTLPEIKPPLLMLLKQNYGFHPDF